MWVSPRRRAGRRRGFPLCPETFSLRCVPQEVWSREQPGMNDAFLANAAEVLANTAIAAAMGGDVKRDLPHETYYAQLRRHHTSGDDYYLTFTRRTLRLSSYQDEAIRSTVEDWADAVGTLD